jgi:hypothetical protein
MRFTLYPFVIAILFITTSITAQTLDHSKSDGKLTAHAFYYSVFCKAQNKADCQSTIPRWTNQKRQNLSVSIRQTQAGFPTESHHLVQKSIDKAIRELNAINADFNLTKSRTSKADIEIMLLGTPRGEKPSNAGILFKSRKIDRANMVLLTLGNVIHAARIVISQDIEPDYIDRVILEEITQALGPRWDILNPYYHKRSIFSQTTDPNVKRLGYQDKQALRMHYPK